MAKKIETVQKDILKIETWIEKKNATLTKNLEITHKAGYMLDYTLENVIQTDRELYSELRSAKENNEKQLIINSIYSIITTVDDYKLKIRDLKRLHKLEAELIVKEDSMTEDQKEAKQKLNTEKELLAYIKKEIDNINIPSLEKWLKEYKEAYINSCNEHLNGYELTKALRDADQAVKDQKIKIIVKTFDKVGTIIDISFGRIGFDGSFNGIVIGEKGTVNIETILAGGYNIQKLHYRVLVK